MMELQNLLRIMDSDGMFAIVDIARYNASLAFQNKWTWRQLNAFLLERNNGAMIIFSTGHMQEWKVRFLIDEVCEEPCFRSLEQNIEVTDGALHLASWGDITCTLQFKNTYLPGFYGGDLRFPVENGHYRAVVRQMVDPENFDANEAAEAHFVVELHRCAPDYRVIQSAMPWADHFPNSDSTFMENDPEEWDALIQNLIAQGKTSNP